MEYIFKGSHNPQDRVMGLYGCGLSVREIAERTGISKSKVGRIVKELSQSVPNPLISNGNPKEELLNEMSLAELKTWINDNVITKIEFEHIKIAIEEAINKRLGYFLKQLNEGREPVPSKFEGYRKF